MNQLNISEAYSIPPEDLQALTQLHRSLFSGPISPRSEQSMVITMPPNMDEQSRSSYHRQDHFRKDLQMLELQEEKNIPNKEICVDPLCFCESRQVLSSDTHPKHKTILLRSLLRELAVLKSNNIFKRFNPQRVTIILSTLDQIYKEVEAFEAFFLSTIQELKLKTRKHIVQVKKSFETDYYQSLRETLLGDFSFQNVSIVLGEIQKFKQFKYQNLDYPQFKSNMMAQRIKEISYNHKELCIVQLKEWIKYLEGDHPNKNKQFNRSIYTFMFKSPSEKKIFSYYLRSPEYFVSDHGRKVQRTDKSQILPIQVLEKKLDEEGVRIRVNKMGAKGVSIGCGILGEMERLGFENCFKKGYFLFENGVLATSKQTTKNTFKYAKGDIISLHRKESLIYFYKIQGGKVVDGFHITLNPFQPADGLSAKQKYYPAVFLGDTDAQLQIVS